MMATRPKADLIVDLQYGSTGKGLIAGYLADTRHYDVVVTANMPNAGHTFIDSAGNKMVHKVLPNGVVSPNCRYALIGPGAVFSIDRLIEEIDTANSFGYHFIVVIHPMATVLNDEHRNDEAAIKSAIGSTGQGSAAAMMEKLGRIDAPVAHRVMGYGDWGRSIMVATTSEYNAIIKHANNILLEGAQGFSLGINEQFYPYCTSRDCTPARFMADMAIPLPMLRKVIGTARTYPIRVASPKGGTSGGCYPDQRELKWSDLGVQAEKTTVTKKTRRVFTFSPLQISDAMYASAPDEVFLNFCNYVTDRNTGIQAPELNNMVEAFKGKVKFLGWGPDVSDVEEVES